MTPFNLTIQNELEVEWQRFADKWLFPWHNLNIEGKVVDVEDFRGGRFHTGGIVFQGQIQQLYWQAVGRYLAAKIDEIFQRWDVASSSYPSDLRRVSVDGLELSLRGFVARIVKQATDTDRALRGRGNPASVSEYNSSGYQSGANAQIHRLVEAHRLLIDRSVPKPCTTARVLTRWQRVERWYGENKAAVWLIGVLITLLGILVKVFA